MEGTYVTKSQRKELSKKITSTHFTLGGDAVAFKTTATASYQPMEAVPALSDQPNKAKMRKSHFTLGHAQGTAQPESEFAAKYKEHALGTTRAETDVKSELRRTHFTFGSHKEPQLSTTAREYKKSVIVQKPEAANTSNNLRKHHFQLGTDKMTMQSLSRACFTGARGTASAPDLQALKQDLRTSHFTLGNDPKQFLSTMQGNFTAKPGVRAESVCSSDGKNQHFSLGSAASVLQSTSHAAFTRPLTSRQSLNLEKLSDLRASHFTLGQSQASYSLSSRSQYVPPEPPTALPDIASQITRSHFGLGTTTVNYTTSYTANYSSKAAQAGKLPRGRAVDCSSQLSLGNQQQAVLSTAQASYRAVRAEPAALNAEVAQNLRKSHFALGVGKPEFSTTSQKYGCGRGQPGEMDKQLLSDLRSAHFTYGNDPATFTTSFQREFQQKRLPQNAYDPELVKNLRNHHFQVGDNTRKWNTEQKSSYKWVQPVPFRP